LELSTEREHSLFRMGASSVRYEIDGYIDDGTKSANGQIEADNRILNEAFRAEDATIVLDSGWCIQVVVSDPQGDLTAEVRVRGGFPL